MLVILPPKMSGYLESKEASELIIMNYSHTVVPLP
jgi:hypothetical protein